MKVKVTYTYSDETKIRTSTIDIKQLAYYLNMLNRTKGVTLLEFEVVAE